MRHHRKEKAFGPSPNNGYTAGSPRRKFWQRKPKTVATRGDVEKPDVLPAHSTPHDVRNSYNTESTAVGNEPVYNKYGNTAVPAVPATGGVVGSGLVNQHHPVNPSVYGQSGNFGQAADGNFVGHQTTTTTHVPAANYSRGGNF